MCILYLLILLSIKRKKRSHPNISRTKLSPSNLGPSVLLVNKENSLCFTHKIIGQSVNQSCSLSPKRFVLGCLSQLQCSVFAVEQTLSAIMKLDT